MASVLLPISGGTSYFNFLVGDGTSGNPYSNQIQVPQFLRNGVYTTPIVDTSTPANSRGMPMVQVPTPLGIAATPTEGTRIPAAIATPEALTASQTLVTSVVIVPGRGGRIANTGSVWIGFSSTNDSQLYELEPINKGGILLNAPPGKKINLATIYVDSVVLNDGVRWFALD